ncbi:uncharacterized protein KY384_001307 [Bacidia gigantensis]|uniref:uncharacterized protein n=1 Tax=Bacidia gigantensis TaxID=2732470 RepID=UPI001D03E41B|nr:uncharacterized protein KY384_001307 [Bacidia gigantensis]KAG8533567.1 hypothetical protein KY384_001307 [Bacidia gigantensis]
MAPTSFASLPPELRIKIYKLALYNTPYVSFRSKSDKSKCSSFECHVGRALLEVQASNALFAAEARHIFFGSNCFILHVADISDFLIGKRDQPRAQVSYDVSHLVRRIKLQSWRKGFWDTHFPVFRRNIHALRDCVNLWIVQMHFRFPGVWRQCWVYHAMTRLDQVLRQSFFARQLRVKIQVEILGCPDAGNVFMFERKGSWVNCWGKFKEEDLQQKLAFRSDVVTGCGCKISPLQIEQKIKEVQDLGLDRAQWETWCTFAAACGSVKPSILEMDRVAEALRSTCIPDDV